jgi:hypothetical protein
VFTLSKQLDDEAKVMDQSEQGKRWAEYLQNLSPGDFGKYKL